LWLGEPGVETCVSEFPQAKYDVGAAREDALSKKDLKSTIVKETTGDYVNCDDI
jgi:hypothetical protein